MNGTQKKSGHRSLADWTVEGSYTNLKHWKINRKKPSGRWKEFPGSGCSAAGLVRCQANGPAFWVREGEEKKKEGKGPGWALIVAAGLRRKQDFNKKREPGLFGPRRAGFVRLQQKNFAVHTIQTFFFEIQNILHKIIF